MRSRLRALVGICVILSPDLAPAQRDLTGVNTGLASIQGRVTLQDSPNQPLEQIPVQLSQSNGVPIGVAHTSGNGQFLFQNLSTGGYEITVSLPGYQRFSQKVNINTASGRLDLQVQLRKLEGQAQADPGAPAVSVGEMLAPAGARRELEKGLEKARKDDPPGAERHFRRAVSLHPAYARAWMELGDLYARTARPREALRSFQEALRHDAKNREALLASARLLNDQGRYVEALRAAAQLEQIYARDPRNHLEIARGLLGAEKVAEAEAAARQLEGEPHSQAPEVHLVLFSILHSRQDKAGAASELRTYLKEVEDSGVARGNPAVARARERLSRLEAEIGAK